MREDLSVLQTDLIQNDLTNRRLALNPSASFLVQAPAGSGKTELLTQRLLSLLSVVNQPEEILAVTFTNKAAGEMKHRVIHALLKVKNEVLPTNDHERTTYELACRVLLRSDELKWDLIKNYHRLCIITMDALSLNLANRLPMLSGLWQNVSPLDNATELYVRASQNVLMYINKDIKNNRAAESVKAVLTHLDNRWDIFEQLSCLLLAKRDQWLPLIYQLKTADNLKAVLENGLLSINEQAIQDLELKFTYLWDTLGGFVNYAVAYIEPQSNLYFCLHQFSSYESLSLGDKKTFWSGMMQWLLTEAGEVRKTVTKQQGFLAKSAFKNKDEQNLASQMKSDFILFLDKLSVDKALILSLGIIKILPPLEYSESAWVLVQSLLELVPYLYAELRLLFEQKKAVDFIEIALASAHALGSDDEPTDLALILDYQISHILIDEFQDTSEVQLQLFSKLTSQWQEGMNRSLFLVGDPMQSIYRFRGAQVGVFLKTKAQGLGDIKLNYIRLSQNFRSAPAIIEFVNACGMSLFPKVEDISTGAITYLPSSATKKDNGYVTTRLIKSDLAQSSQSMDVSILPSNRLKDVMSLQMLNDIKECLSKGASSIAILVRYRQHAKAVLEALKTEGIAFEAIDMHPLVNKDFIADLRALTFSMSDLSDKVAWLALLRAPFTGLSLADLTLLCSNREEPIVYQQLKSAFEGFITLSEDGRSRIARVFPILQRWIEQRGRLSYPRYIKSLWISLGGHYAIPQDANKDVERFFDELTKMDSAKESLSMLDERLNLLYAQSHNNAIVKVMTIHKAKGLEFEYVFIPHLEKRPKMDDKQLFIWMNHLSKEEVNPHLILAPFQSCLSKEEEIYHYVQYANNQKQHFESMRLLYVALTRAKLGLYLYAALDDGKEPTKGSFLSMIYAQFANKLNLDLTVDDKIKDIQTDVILQSAYKRFTPDFTLSERESTFLAIDEPLEQDNLAGELPALWHQKESILSPDTLRHIGTCVHQALYFISKMTPEVFQANMSNIDLKRRLLDLGVPSREMLPALDMVQIAIKNALKCPKGAWILSPKDEAYSEWPLVLARDLSSQKSKILKQKQDPYQRMVIDRAFVDNGVWWIIDYKIIHQNPSNDHEWSMVASPYQSQLKNYHYALSMMGRGKVRCGLYFPMQAHFIEMSF